MRVCLRGDFVSYRLFNLHLQCMLAVESVIIGGKDMMLPATRRSIVLPEVLSCASSCLLNRFWGTNDLWYLC